MIHYIDKLMGDWAHWTKVRKDGGLGYPRKAFGFNLTPSGGSHGDIVGIDEQSMEIERIVARLRIEKKDLYKVVEWFYLSGDVSVEHMSNRLGCSRQTVYERVHRVHKYVVDAMHDNEIERQDRIAEYKNKDTLKKHVDSSLQFHYNSVKVVNRASR